MALSPSTIVDDKDEVFRAMLPAGVTVCPAIMPMQMLWIQDEVIIATHLDLRLWLLKER
jgi:hypothetical protein